MKTEITPESIYKKLVKEYGTTAPDWLEGLFVFLGNVLFLDDPEKVAKMTILSKSFDHDDKLFLFNIVLATEFKMYELAFNKEDLRLIIDGMTKFINELEFADEVFPKPQSLSR